MRSSLHAFEPPTVAAHVGLGMQHSVSVECEVHINREIIIIIL
jgi:hypothetical protein